MDLVTGVGIGASILTSTSLVPQLVKLIKEKKADDVSLGMLVVLWAGLGLWMESCVTTSLLSHQMHSLRL